jgi:hypothetical protein
VLVHVIKGADENLPDLTSRESTPAGHLAMTGTDPVVTPISEILSHHFPTVGDVSGPNLSLAGVMAQPSDAICINENPPGKPGD